MVLSLVPGTAIEWGPASWWDRVLIVTTVEPPRDVTFVDIL